MAADEVSDDKQTCWTMIADAATGDREARSRFCRSYLPLVRAYLGERWRHGPLAQQVDDAAQEVMIECLSSNGPVERADIERPGGFRAFLLGVVRHIAQRFERRVGTDRLLVGESTAIREAPAREDALSQVFDRQWALALMEEARVLMEENARLAGDTGWQRVELLNLRFGKGLPVREIAARWGVDADSVHRAYAKAREDFRACLRRVVAFHAVRSEPDLDAEVSRVLAALE